MRSRLVSSALAVAMMTILMAMASSTFGALEAKAITVNIVNNSNRTIKVTIICPGGTPKVTVKVPPHTTVTVTVDCPPPPQRKLAYCAGDFDLPPVGCSPPLDVDGECVQACTTDQGPDESTITVNTWPGPCPCP